MAHHDLFKSISVYKTSLETLARHSKPLPSEIMTVLKARDNIVRSLFDNKIDPTDALLKIVEMDLQLYTLRDKITLSISLPEWRASLRPDKDSWWWFLDESTQMYPAGKFGWFWSVLTLVFLIISLSLLFNISTRFLSGGADIFGAFAVATQSILTAFTAGGALTKWGREGLEQIIRNFNVPRSYWQGAKLGSSILLTSLLIGFWFLMPQIAIRYNNLGIEQYRTGQLASAQYNYTRALKLNPDYPEAHYNLGLLYEDLNDITGAQTEYRFAVKGGLDAAYNNLSRLYIADGKYEQAIPLLLSGLDRSQDDEIRYAFLKNLGWARLKQGRYAEAEGYLDAAISLSGERAAAYCLIAQVFDAQNRSNEALPMWTNCLMYATERNPDEDIWIYMARQHLDSSGENK